ncbi:complement C1q-like protein 3 [Saccostrea echinata]|uniref:complement C1q-like protein 3 n=1 Tax=Saccostrea echinata TaxID=191078 RepID=UPI002A80CE7A|nr:complement C1q-like protein 3 [Saccostrea echinata]
MLYFLRIWFICILSRFLIASSLLSNKNDGKTYRDFVTDDSKGTDIVRQLLNQETIIRMTLTNNVQSLMKDMLTLKKSMELRLSQLEGEVKQLKTENQQLDSDLRSMKAKERNLSTLVATFQASLSNVSSLVSGKTKKVCFTAAVTSYNTSWNRGTLIFPFVITNEGNGYNPSNGIFTAPTDGMYVFFVNVQSYSTQQIHADIVLNGSTKVRTLAYSTGTGDYYDAGPNMVVLAIQKGDAVWVKHHSGTGYYTHSDGPMTTFSGFLI